MDSNNENDEKKDIPKTRQTLRLNPRRTVSVFLSDLSCIRDNITDQQILNAIDKAYEAVRELGVELERD
jgi:hypothetical protein